MQAGDCHGLTAGSGVASMLVNYSSELLVYLDVGDRSEGDEVEYPNDDLKARQLVHGVWRLTHKDGRPY